MKPAVVLLHSSMSSRAQWSKLAALLQNDFHCIAIDLLGYGASPFPGDVQGFSLAHEADAVAAAIAAHLPAKAPFHLLGHSYGGATALRLARGMPGRVLSLALFEPVAFHLLAADAPARRSIVAVVEAMKRAGSELEAAAIFIDYWNRPGVFAALPPSQQERFAAQVGKVALDFQALLGEPARLADMAQLAMPALVMAGQSSPMTTRAVAAALAGALPDGELLETVGGHMAPLTHADAINAHFCAFLREFVSLEAS